MIRAVRNDSSPAGRRPRARLLAVLALLALIACIARRRGDSAAALPPSGPSGKARRRGLKQAWAAGLCFLLVCSLLTFRPRQAGAATFIVTNTLDNGAGSLRQAVIDANNTPGVPDDIEFAISGPGPHQIVLGSALTISDTVTIDGTTQPGFAGTPVIELIGADVQFPPNGIVVGPSAGASGTVIRGLAINRFATGILLDGVSSVTVEGNFIGTDVTGSIANPNSIGVRLTNANTNTISGNLISGNANDGILIDGTSSRNVISDNTIGLDLSQTADLGNRVYGVEISSPLALDNVIGEATGPSNIISGNDSAGIRDEGSGTQILGNWIGLDGTGTGAIGNRVGIDLGESESPDIVGNVVSGNEGAGISGATRDALIQRNLIGTDAAGTSPVPNGGAGIDLIAITTVIGSENPGEGNVIAFNVAEGVLVGGGSTGVSVRGNSIHSNGGLGLDVTDAQSSPVLTSATTDGSTTTVTGTLISTPDTSFTIDLYSNAACDPSGFGEGQTYLGSTTVTTDSSGMGAFGVVVPARPGEPFMTATATDPDGNTSEFSACLQEVVVPRLSVDDVTVAEGAGSATFTVTLSAPSAQDVTVGYATVDGTATAGTDYTPASGTLTIPAGATSATVNVPLTNDALDEANETFFLNLSGPTNATIADAQGQATIVDDDLPPTLSVNDVTVAEGAGSATFTVTLSAPSAQDVTVGYATVDGTATAGTDYTPASGTLTIPAGATSATVNVPLTNDALDEANETFFLNLSGPTNATIADAQGQATIVDDDLPPTTTTSTTSTSTTLPPTTSTSTSTTTATTLPPTSTTSTSTTTTLPPTSTTSSTTSTTTTLPPTSTTSSTTSSSTTSSSTTSTSTTSTTRPPTSTSSTTTTRPPTTTSSTSTTSTTTTSTTTPPPITTSSTSTSTTSTSTTSTTTTTTVPPTTTSTTVPPTTTTGPTTTTSTPTTTTTAPPAPPVGTTTTVGTAPVVTTTATTPFTSPLPTTLFTTSPSTTTVALTPSTLTPTTIPPTTLRPTTTLPPPRTPPTTAPGPAGASLRAVSPDGQPSGPPGVALDVSGGGYLGCRTVYFFFDGVRIGTDTPNAAGFVGVGMLSVPGDADPGEHRITSSCSASGGPIRASTTFLVTDADVHRAAFATSLPQPDQVSLELERILASAAVAIAIILLFAFPSKLFNSTVEENYDEIRAWFRMPARAVDTASSVSRTLTFFALSVVAAVVLGFLDPKFGWNLNSLVIVIGFTLSLIVMSAGFSLPAAIGVRRQTGEWGKLNFLPGTLLVSIAMVIASRILDFKPGYFYGALGGVAFASVLNARTQGRLTAANWMFALVISVAAWFARMPVSEAAAQPDPALFWVGFEAFLVLTFLWGVESLVVAMLPMRFLDGPKVMAWNRVVWVVLLLAGLFATIHVLLSPSAGYVGHTTDEVTIGVLVIFAIFGALSVGLWAYFRYRPRRLGPRIAQ